MMQNTPSANTPVTIAPISAELIAAAFQCLALIPKQDRLDPAVMIAIARVITRSEGEAMALFARIRALGMVMRDPLWQPWEAYFRNCDARERRCFAFHIRRLAGILPVTRDLRFSSDAFFEELLSGGIAKERE